MCASRASSAVSGLPNDRGEDDGWGTNGSSRCPQLTLSWSLLQWKRVSPELYSKVSLCVAVKKAWRCVVFPYLLAWSIITSLSSIFLAVCHYMRWSAKIISWAFTYFWSKQRSFIFLIQCTSCPWLPKLWNTESLMQLEVGIINIVYKHEIKKNIFQFFKRNIHYKKNL